MARSIDPPSGLITAARDMLTGAGGLYAQRREELERAENLCDDAETLSCPCCEGVIDRTFLESHRKQCLENARSIDAEIRLYHRFLDPELMGDVYTWLRDFKDEDWALFMFAALQARLDFSAFMELRKRAAKAAASLEKQARQMRKSIRELRETGVMLPDVLMPVYRDDDPGEWFGGSKALAYAKFVRLARSSRAAAQQEAVKEDAIRWLGTIQLAASSVEARFACPAINAGISKRQKSKKAAYLRAFAALLQDAGIELSTNIIKSMAVTSNVVFDDPDCDFSEDEVRKAIHR